MDLRTNIWEHMLDAELNKRFYAKLVARAHARHRLLSAGTLVATSAAGVNFGTQLAGAWATGLLALLATGFAAVNGAWDFRREALDAERLCETWMAIGADWDALWADYESGATAGARARFEAIDQRVRRAIVQGLRFDDDALAAGLMPVVERVRGAVTT